MTNATRNARFQKGSAVYTCLVCKKTTRETGRSESGAELCAFCYEVASEENALSDGIIDQAEFDARMVDLRAKYKRDDRSEMESKVEQSGEPVAETKPAKVAKSGDEKKAAKAARKARRAAIRRYLDAANYYVWTIASEEPTEVQLDAKNALTVADAELAKFAGYEK